jgi:hypothetical protein
MNFGTLILDYSWHQAAMSFIAAAAIAGAGIMLSRCSVVSPWRLLGAAIVSVTFAGIGVETVTSSTRIDARGITIDAPLDLVQRHAFLSWQDMIGAEIIPEAGFNQRQGLRLVSRTGSEIVIPIGALADENRALLIDRVAAQPTARMLPDVGRFYAKLDEIAPRLGAGALRARASYQHVALHWFQPQAF